MRAVEKITQIKETNSTSKLLIKLFGTDSSSCINSKFHFTYFFVDILNKCDHEINQLFLNHIFCVSVGYQKTYVVVLTKLKIDQN